jgi:hypothetical protein
MRRSTRTIRSISLLAPALCAVVVVSGCANERHASAPIGWSRGEITAIAPYPANEPGGVMAWTASTPGPVAHSMAARRDAALIPAPPAPLTSTSVWPGPAVPRESRRIPIIYSRWGRSF